MAASRLLLLSSLVLLAPRAVHAQSAIASADALYKEGKKLMKEGNVAEACKKFQASYDLEKAGGVLLNLAECHMKEGKVATAHGEFQAALELATRDRNAERVKHAQKRIKELDGQVPRLTLTFDGPRPKGLSVKLDGTELGEGALGSALPIDPGRHALVLSAPKHGSRELSVEITKAGEQKSLALPALEPEKEPEDAPRPPPPPPPAPSGGWMWPVGFTALGVGVAGLAVGAGFGAVALDKGAVVSRECPNDLCSQAGMDAYDAGRAAALASDVGLIAGGALAATGIVILLVAPAAAAPWAKPAGRASSAPRLLAVVPRVDASTFGASTLFAW